MTLFFGALPPAAALPSVDRFHCMVKALGGLEAVCGPVKRPERWRQGRAGVFGVVKLPY